MRAVVHLDRNGERRRELSPRGVAFRDYRIAHPEATDREAAKAIGGAADSAIAAWKAHPQYVGPVGFMGKKHVEEAYAERDAWVARVKRRGDRAEKLGQMAAALKSDDMLAERVPIDGILSGRDLPKSSGDTYNTVIVGELRKQFTIEELRALAATLKGEA